MVDSRDAIVLSGILVALLSIPAASERINIEEGPENGLDAEIETNLSDKFSLEMSPGKERIEMVDSTSSYTRDQKPSKKIKKITSPEGILKVRKSNNSILKTVETPYGTLKTGIKNGKRFSDFSGLNKSKVRDVKKKLSDRLAKKGREADAKRRTVLEKVLTDIELEVSEGGEDEHINLTNKESSSISTEGWTVENDEGDVYTISGSLSADGTLTLFSKEYDSDLENSVSETDVTLYSTGGEIRVYNEEDYLLASEDY